MLNACFHRTPPIQQEVVNRNDKPIELDPKDAKVLRQLTTAKAPHIVTSKFNFKTDDNGKVVWLTITRTKTVDRDILSKITQLDQLQHLRLTQVKITDFNQLNKLKKLKVLVLSYCNGLGERLVIPPNLASLNRLTITSGFTRKPTQQADKIADIVFPEGSQLTFLQIENMRLTSMHSSFKKLNRLKELILGGNLLTSVNLDLSHFKKLEFVSLRSNPIENIELLRQKYKHILIAFN